ncbi:MAG: sigma-54 dependent transcriptional regulator [Pseudomonadota bacterium]
MSTTHKALIVDDEPDIRELLSMTLEVMGIHVTPAAGVEEAKGLLKAQTFDVCLTDMRMPDGDGLELLAWMQEHVPTLPVAMITAHGSVETAVQALKLGAFDFISKPLDVSNLRAIINGALRLKDSSTANTSVELSDNSPLIGESPIMREVKKVIERVARSQAPVHICGESGTGKELVARMIHDQGSRASAPFVPINCGAIPAELMESELFGHTKGAFTGAVADKQGLIASAHNGTVFLDEIADLPLAMQVKLLRVIQEKTLRRVGDSEEISVDVRILSATHKKLAMLVSNNQFREDLFYRINVIELAVPPLRERGNDIQLIATKLLAAMSERQEGVHYTLTNAAYSALSGYAFPGNVRELENILERAITLSGKTELDAGDLDINNGEDSAPANTESGGALGSQLQDVERQAIVDALEQTRYNKTAAAKLLGLSFRQLRYRIKKLGID